MPAASCGGDPLSTVANTPLLEHATILGTETGKVHK